jgi:hypothetical protein
MTTKRPAEARREESPGGLPERSAQGQTHWATRLELVPRLQAIADELDIVDADLDVPRTLLAGVIEDLEAAAL